MGAAWHFREIEVLNLQTGAVSRFVYNDWLQKSEANPTASVTLKEVNSAEMKAARTKASGEEGRGESLWQAGRREGWGAQGRGGLRAGGGGGKEGGSTKAISCVMLVVLLYLCPDDTLSKGIYAAQMLNCPSV